jgi:glycosyltransferase involved in cell wall biosynthesis
MELIFINDASTDQSLEMLQEFSLRAPGRINVINLEENHGPGGARNFGIKAAKGDYVAFMDCDDLVKSEMYESLYQAAVSEILQADVADSGVENEADGTIRFYTTKEMAGRSDVQKKSIQLLSVGYIWSRIYRRKFLEENRIVFRENAVMEDQDFLCEVIARADYTVCVEDVFYFYRDIPNSASKRDAEIEFFHSTIDTIQSTYQRLQKLSCYEGIRMATEYTFWQLYLMNLQTVDAYVDGNIIDERMRNQMREILGRVIKKCIHTCARHNCYVKEKMSAEEMQRIEEG